MTVSESAPLRGETVRAVSGNGHRNGAGGAASAASERTPAADELAAAVARAFRAEHVFVAAGDPAPLVAALWQHAVRATPADGIPAPTAYELVVALGDGGGPELLDAAVARAETVVVIETGRPREPAASLLATIERFAARSFDVDPFAEPTLAGAPAFVFRRAASALPADVRRAYARLLSRATNADREAELAALRDRLAAAEREVEHLGVLVGVERSDRVRVEADLQRVVEALAEANDELAEQLDAVRAARGALDRDIQALSGSRLWRWKLALARRGRAAAR